ncbi:MAG: TlpA disulfide reductase family protein [Candidatus Dormibacteria bacterium]
MNRRFLAAAFISALMLAGCGLQQDLAQVPIGNGPTGPATPITAPTVTGTPYDWSTTHGHVVVLDFWGSWCGPCNGEQPALDTLARQWMPKGVIFLGVDIQDTDPNAIAYERSYNVPYPSVNDSSEVITSEYNVLDPPTIVIVDAKGNIVDRFLGTLVGVANDLTRLTS